MAGSAPVVHALEHALSKDVNARHTTGMTGGGSVQTVTAELAQQDVFAANRATGRVTLAVASAHGRTRRKAVHESGSLRVRFPNSGDALEAVIVNTGGGMTGGDRFAVDIALGERAELVAGTAAAEKIYRSTGPDAEIAIKLSVSEGARLAWLPQETILFDRARLRRRIEIDLAEGASLLVAETIVFGRTAMSEAVHTGAWHDTWRLRCAGRLVFAENVQLDGAVAGKLAAPAVAGGAIALATILIAPADESVLEPVRALAFSGEAGISAWNGIAVARLIAGDGAALRRDLLAILAALGQPVPRLWLQ